MGNLTNVMCAECADNFNLTAEGICVMIPANCTMVD